jgi:hypothetical protein
MIRDDSYPAGLGASGEYKDGMWHRKGTENPFEQPEPLTPVQQAQADIEVLKSAMTMMAGRMATLASAVASLTPAAPVTAAPEPAPVAAPQEPVAPEAPSPPAPEAVTAAAPAAPAEPVAPAPLAI